jgi:hypothetical protein
MSADNLSIVSRVNFFDGQKITEADLDQEQSHQRSLSSGHVSTSHGSGVVKDNPIENRILLDTSAPSTYGTNETEYEITTGLYDGKPIKLDRQPSNSDTGVRLFVEVSNATIRSAHPLKVLVFGSRYNPLDTRGELVYEVIEFYEEKVKVTENYYKKIFAVYFNNLSGGIGQTYYDESVNSLNYFSEYNTKVTIYEAEPLRIFPRTQVSLQTQSPSFDINNFITYSTSKTINEILEEALDSTFSINELYLEKDPSSVLAFNQGDSSSVAYGQKFIAKAGNVQKISLLVGVADPLVEFSGSLVLSIHKLTTSANCITDAIPDNLINFDPEAASIAEVSYSNEDLVANGITLTSGPIVVDFDFSSTLLANPLLDPKLEKDAYYCFILKRVGDTSSGTIHLYNGYGKKYRKEDNGQSLTIEEQFKKDESIFTQYDIVNSKFVDDSSLSLWYQIHSATFEVTSGKAYSYDGFPIEIPTTEVFVGGNLISYSLKNIELINISGLKNYVIIERAEKFSNPITHPRTGNYTFTRITDSCEISVLSEDSLMSIMDMNPIILGSLTDNNNRSPSDITGSMEYPGLLNPNNLYFVNPPQYLLSRTLVDRIFIPDVDCGCSSRYKIDSVSCRTLKAGDFNDDGKLDANDIITMLSLAGNVINSSVTETNLINGSLSYVDFYKADLNNDKSIDSSDIELLEDAVYGFYNFSIPKEFVLLEMKLSNISKDSDHPVIFEDAANSSSSINSTNTIVFTSTSYEIIRIIRSGDTVVIPETEIDAGNYVVSSVTNSLLTTTLTVINEDGTTPNFVGSPNFNVVITSGSEVNTFADNNALAVVPFISRDWKIAGAGNNFSDRFINNVDLRRFIEQSFFEEQATECVCSDDNCFSDPTPSPIIKNQKVIPNDLYIPNGNILSAKGVPHHGDYEYTNIAITLPPGTIADCSINIYDSFIKSYNGTCYTAAGYPAMKYSDGTLVGCNDSESDTDIASGKVKISKAISSLYVDALVDGYAADGYTTSASTTIAASNAILDVSTTEVASSGFSLWNGLSSAGYTEVDTSDSSFATFTVTPGSNSEATLDKLGTFSGDFTVDFKAKRTTWDSSKLSLGTVEFFAEINIDNLTNGTSTARLGWTQSDSGIKLFWAGEVKDTSSAILSQFEFLLDTPEAEGLDLFFRIRRVNDVVTAYYFNPNDSSEIINESYHKIGDLLDMQLGEGDSTFGFAAVQSDNLAAEASYQYIVDVYSYNFQIKSDEVTEDVISSSEILVGKNSSFINELTFNMPVQVNSKTEVISATLTLKASRDYTVDSSDTFYLIPYSNINADNLSKYIDLVLSTNTSLIQTISGGTTGLAGSSIELDITNAVTNMLAQPGHLPGYYKAFLLTTDTTAVTELYITNEISLSIVYSDITTGVVFQVGSVLDPLTGVLTLKTKNILYDSLNAANRTVINFGVALKKAGFKNSDLSIGINELKNVGIGTCVPDSAVTSSDDCFFVTGSSTTGVFVEGPFPCTTT